MSLQQKKAIRGNEVQENGAGNHTPHVSHTLLLLLLPSSPPVPLYFDSLMMFSLSLLFPTSAAASLAIAERDSGGGGERHPGTRVHMSNTTKNNDKKEPCDLSFKYNLHTL